MFLILFYVLQYYSKHLFPTDGATFNSMVDLSTCISRVKNLCVKVCLHIIQIESKFVRNVISCISSSGKRRDLLNSIKPELGERIAIIPTLHVEPRWSSTLRMMRKAYSVRSVLNTIANQISELRSSVISDSEWLTTSKVQIFLLSAASFTTEQDGLLYVSNGAFCLDYRTIMLKCERTLQSGDQTLVPTANAMHEKL